jgi:hypothetical protein
VHLNEDPVPVDGNSLRGPRLVKIRLALGLLDEVFPICDTIDQNAVESVS